MSWTVMGRSQLARLPALSVALQDASVVPRGKVEPEAGAHAVVTPPQLSVARVT
ncbi:Hypothetical protein AA314_02843 [Archangium gephyra]|uniref:Uncharacterized protein n=1 Tax=Archangium gephyra TaxID=48 RepID=A0AAC8TCP2_9BACT|nr:Hypothetical protein AA314_02843 [Archangium gephyra]